MLLSPDQLVEKIHDSPTRIVLAATGGGSRAIADLLEVPGGSRTLLEAVVPYSGPALAAWLGSAPDEACSAATARSMAMIAFQRARQYDCTRPQPEGATVAGVACTASLATDRPKRGPHRVHVALQTVALSAAWWLQLQKGRRARAEEERLAGRLVLNVVAEACGVAQRLSLDLLEGERMEESRTQAPQPWQDLLLGKVDCIRVHGAGGTQETARELCGAAVPAAQAGQPPAPQAAGGTPAPQPLAVFPGRVQSLARGPSPHGAGCPRDIAAAGGDGNLDQQRR